MGKWKKLTAFAPALAAVIVAACAGISLNGYTAPVYAVEQPEALVTPESEQDTDAAEKKDDTKKKEDTKKKTTDTKAETVAAVGSGSFELADGTYEGSGTGFGGTITVSVVLKDKTIQSISIVSAPGEDATFLNRAKGVIDRIIASQSVDVDTVSGATFSSKGILAAVKNALAGQADISEPASASGAAGGAASGGTVTVSKIEEPAAYRDGTYYGTGTGFGGTMKVCVVVSGGKITSIDIVENSDTPSYLSSASSLISTIISTQSTNVDTVSGATYSSRGIIEAVRSALSQAAVSGSSSTGGNSNNTSSGNNSQNNGNGNGQNNNSSASKGNFPYKDGIYYGIAAGFQGDIKVAVALQDQTIKAVLILENEDDETFFNRAKVVADRIVDNQKTDVDLVSGATYSSRGIQNAVKQALENAKKATNGETIPDNGANSGDTTTIPEGKFPYEEGIYYGTGEGYLGDITTAVVIQDDTIKAILVTESEDDEAFLKRAKQTAKDVVKNQTLEVDTVSGATYSSKGILAAIEEALKEAERVTEEKKNPTPSPTPTETPTPTPTETPAPTPTETPDPTPTETPEQRIYQDGEYTAYAVCEPDEDEDFTAYQLSVTVTITNDKIVALGNIAGDGDSQNASYIRRAAEGTSKIKGVTAQILETGTLENIDTVSRATCSSKAILEACQNALDAAKVTQ